MKWRVILKDTLAQIRSRVIFLNLVVSEPLAATWDLPPTVLPNPTLDSCTEGQWDFFISTQEGYTTGFFRRQLAFYGMDKNCL